MKALDSYISDSELMERISSGDRKAYYLLFDRYWESLYVTARSMLGDAELSKDVLQDVWLSLWERRRQVQGDNIRAYLVQAVKFRIYKEWRDSKLTSEHEALLARLPAPDTTEEMLNSKELKQQVCEWVKELPEKCGRVFRLSRFDQLSNSEIADQLNLSQRTVETHISNALKFLRKRMDLFFLVVPFF